MIQIKKAGLMTTIQDLGRPGYLSQGVPISGAMDGLSAQIANIAIGNNANDAVIEFTQSGASFSTEAEVLLCLSGDGACLKAGTQQLPANRPLFIPSGMELHLENLPSGCRSYLAVAGGWDVPEVLDSRSTYIMAKFGGLEGRCLKPNDLLKSTGEISAITMAIGDSLKGDAINYPKWSIARDLFLPTNRNTIRITRGREFDWFDRSAINTFFSHDYSLGHSSNRMGYQLEGKALSRSLAGELISTAVTPGTVQVTNNGDLILLMADCQTTGGYPRVAQVAAVDMPLCAQLKAGDCINFKEIGWKEAEKLYIQQKLDLCKLAFTIGQKYAIT